LNPENAYAWIGIGRVHLAISLQEFKKKNSGNALENLESAMAPLDSFSRFLKDKEKAKKAINGAIMKFLKELIKTGNVETVKMALKALFETEKEILKDLFEPIFIATEIVESKDINKYYELQVERREVVAEIVKKLTGSEELLPVEYRSR